MDGVCRSAQMGTPSRPNCNLNHTLFTLSLSENLSMWPETNLKDFPPHIKPPFMKIYSPEIFT
jgi:hypothetical protein